MALAVDLIGLDTEGKVLWRWMARRWDGHIAAREADLPPGDWPESWSGRVTLDQVIRLRERFGGKTAESDFGRPEDDLDSLLEQPRTALLLVVEEWGST